jgi:hypothetical protein
MDDSLESFAPSRQGHEYCPPNGSEWPLFFHGRCHGHKIEAIHPLCELKFWCRSYWAFVAACVLAGCLPTGDPPAGQHRIFDRLLTSVWFSPSQTEGVPSHLLITGPGENVTWNSSRYWVAPLYLVPEGSSPTGGQGSVVLIGNRYRDPLNSSHPIDSRGRIFGLFYSEEASESAFEIRRVDLLANTQEYLGLDASDTSHSALTLSPAKTRFFVGWNDIAVYDLDQPAFPVLATRDSSTFVGDELYFSSNPDNLIPNVWSFEPNGQPEKLFDEAELVSAVSTAQGPRLLLRLASNPKASSGFALLDPETLQASTFLPEHEPTLLSWGWASPSPDGRWLPVVVFFPSWSKPHTMDTWLLAFLDLTTAEIQTTDFRLSSAREGPLLGEWRPGRSEFWFATYTKELAIWKPETWVTSPQRSRPFSYYRAPNGPSSIFTQDGRYFFATEEEDETVVYVGSADEPEGPLFQLNPSGTKTLSYSQLTDGRLLIGYFSAADSKRSDYLVVNPDTKTSQPFTSASYVVAIGNSRALMLVDWDSTAGSGNLALIDYQTGKQTLLAESAYVAAVDPGPSAVSPPADALAPGTRVAYLLRYRIASPYDGLWVAELP